MAFLIVALGNIPETALRGFPRHVPAGLMGFVARCSSRGRAGLTQPGL
jgi:hypothetical protein